MIILSEIRREIHNWWSYRVDAILDIVIYTVMTFILLNMFSDMAEQSGTVYGIEKQAASVLGILMWHWCMRVMAEFSSTITRESETGTLEALALSTPMINVLAARAIAISILRGIQVVIMAVVLITFLSLEFHFSVLAITVVLLTLAGVCGLGIGAAGIALVHKQANSITALVAQMSLLAAGALVPINSLGIVFTVLKVIFPMTWGTDILRQLMIANVDPQALAVDVFGLIIQTALMIAIGIIIFRVFMKKARLESTLATY